MSFLVPIAMGLVCVAMTLNSRTLTEQVICGVCALGCFLLAAYDLRYPV